MLNAIIADDEIMICELIKTLGHWERFDIHVSDFATDGEKLLNDIRMIKPDIVITDIRMPVYDGLEVIKRVKELGLETEFIIISGYRYFEYAHNALEYGVSDYLLKPISEDQLNFSLEKISKRILSRRNQMESDLRLDHLTKANEVRLRAGFWDDLADGKLVQEDGVSLNRRYDLQFAYPMYQIFKINTNQIAFHQGESSFYQRINEILCRLIPTQGYAICFTRLEGVFGIVNGNVSDTGEARRLMYLLFAEIRALQDIYGDFHLAMGVSQLGSIGALNSLYEEAVALEQFKLIYGWNKVYTQVPLSHASTISAKQLLPDVLRKTLAQLLENCQTAQLKEAFVQLKQHAEQKKPELDPCSIRQINNSLAELYWDHMKACGQDIDRQEQMHMSMRADRVQDLGSFFDFYCEQFCTFSQNKLEQRETNEAKPILDAKAYIQQHYSTPLTLEEVADVVNYNRAYFSTVFKKHTGLGFTDYLTDVRIDAAKELLKKSNKRIVDVSAIVGYTDDKYFRKLFKKLVGMKPAEYRRLYNRSGG
jgi:two-component system response regulator YesN